MTPTGHRIELTTARPEVPSAMQIREVATSASPSRNTNSLPLPRCPRYEALDLWRGMACLLVVIYHSTMVQVATLPGSQDESRLAAIAAWVLSATHWMWIGVPIFFVISGYCISAAADATRRRPHSLRSYFIRRFRRIYPPFWAVVVLSFLFIGAVDLIVPRFLSGEPVPMFRPWWYSGWQWLGSLTLTETWRHHVFGGARAQFPGHAWTLCYEEQFYAVMGLLLLVAARRLFLAAAIVTGLTLVAGAVSSRFGIPVSGFFFDGNWILFAAGILVYYRLNYAHARAKWLLDGILVSGLICVGTGFVMWETSSISREALVAGFSFALLISLTQQWDACLCSAVVLRPLTFCGTICYSLYLVHPPIVRAVSKGSCLLGVSDDLGTLLVTTPLCVALSVAAGWAFHRGVEQRFLNRPVALA